MAKSKGQSKEQKGQEAGGLRSRIGLRREAEAIRAELLGLSNCPALPEGLEQSGLPPAIFRSLKRDGRVNLSSLNNEAHLRCMRAARKLLLELGGNEPRLGMLLEELSELLQREEHAVATVQHNRLGQILAEADARRDLAYHCFVTYIAAWQCQSEGEPAAAATRIQRLLARYGSLRSKSYHEEKAAIYNLLYTVSNQAADDLVLLGAEACLMSLSHATQRFYNLMAQAFNHHCGQELVVLQDLRKQFDAFWTYTLTLVRALELLRDSVVLPGTGHTLDEQLVACLGRGGGKGPPTEAGEAEVGCVVAEPDSLNETI